MRAQSVSALQDSCYRYLEQNDSAAFHQTYLRIFDAYVRQMDTVMYALKNELCAMGTKDQSIRILLMDAQKKYGKDDFHTKNIRAIMNEIDRVHARRVTAIVDEYGWLSAEEIGEDANDALFLCIQHCNDTVIQHTYLPILKKAVEEGAAKKWQYAFLTDRCLMNQGKAQMYGTQTIKAKDKRTYVVPLQDVDRVNEWRKELGLSPLAEYMEYFGEEWSEEIYKKELPQCEEAFRNWYTERK